MNVILTGFAYAATFIATEKAAQVVARRQGQFPGVHKPAYRISSSLLPQFPLGYFRNDGYLYDVREFIDPATVSLIAEDLWTGNEFNFVVSALDYTSNLVNYKYDIGEFWKYPSEILRDGADDCEGSAILLESIILNKIPHDRAWVAVGLVGKEGHAWNLYQETDGTWWYIDAVADDMWIPGREYRLEYLFNDTQARRG